jgi:hypothetical protein
MKLFELITEAPVKKAAKTKADYKAQPFVGLNYEKVLLDAGKKVAAYIKKNCKPWLSQTQNGRLCVYRGFSHENLPIPAFIKAVRPDRKPRDSDKDWHVSVDYAISLAGKTANRSNSLFTSGSYGVATGYGNTYVVIPIGDFNYTWHVDINDWHGSVDLQDIFQKKPKKEKAKPKAATPDVQLTPAQEKAWQKQRAQYLADMKEVLEFGKEIKAKVFPSKSVQTVMRALVGMTKATEGAWGDKRAMNPVYIGPKGKLFPNVDKDWTVGSVYVPLEGTYEGIKRYSLGHTWSGQYEKTVTYKLQEYIRKLSSDKRAKLAEMIAKMETHLNAEILKQSIGPTKLFLKPTYYAKNYRYSPIYRGPSVAFKPKPFQYKSYSDYLSAKEKFDGALEQLKSDKEKKMNKYLTKAHSYWTPKDPIETLDLDNFKKEFANFLKGDDKTLAQGIKTGNEIMIAAANTIAIQPTFYKDIVVPLLNNAKPKIDTSNLKKYMDVEGDVDGW